MRLPILPQLPTILALTLWMFASPVVLAQVPLNFYGGRTCEQARVVSSGAHYFDLSSAEACLGGLGTVWFKYTADCTGTWEARTCGAPSYIFVYSACGSGSLGTSLSCGLSGETIFNSATVGDDFWIRVRGVCSYFNQGTLIITCSPPGCTDSNPCTLDTLVIPSGGTEPECTHLAIADTDGDGFCNAEDNCPLLGGRIGDTCDDGNPNTINDRVNYDCQCRGSSDNTCTALPLALGLNGPFDNTGATLETGEPSPPVGNCGVDYPEGFCWSQGLDRTVWYTLTVPPSGRVRIKAIAISMVGVPQLALYASPDCVNLLQNGIVWLQAGDDDGSGIAVLDNLCLAPGQVCYVQVDDHNGAGLFHLSIEELPAIGTACDDGLDCTINDVVGTNCVCAGTVNVGGACDDGLDCTINDVYDANCTCAGTVNEGGACDDGLDCTINDVYNANCTCAGTANEGGACDDGLDCTINDVYGADCTCLGTANVGAACDDGCIWTINDVYDANCNCVGTPTGAACDDGCIWTINDVYDANCNCVGTPTGAACDDGSVCTINDMYDASCNCVGTPVVVTDNDPCTADYCDAAVPPFFLHAPYPDSDGDGLCDAIDPTPDCIVGMPCDDGDPCTANDVVGANCQCAGAPVIPGTACDDGDPCTTGDTWDANCQCLGTPDLMDTDNDGISDSCDPCPLTGLVSGQSCDDGNANTVSDFMVGCTCVGSPINCNDSLYWTLDTYEFDNQGQPVCTHTAYDDSDGDGSYDPWDSCPYLAGWVGGPCDDGNVHTVGDHINSDCQCQGAADNPCVANWLHLGVNGPFSNAGATRLPTESTPPFVHGFYCDGDCGSLCNFCVENTPPGYWWYNGDLLIPAEKTVWFRFVAPPSGMVNVTFNFPNISPRDAKIALWSASSCNDLNIGTAELINAVDQQSPMNGHEMHNLCLNPGEDYFIQVEGESLFGSPPVDLYFNIDIEEMPTQIGTACNDGDPNTTNDMWQANCTCAGTINGLRVAAKVALEGPYDASTGLMNDALRSLGTFPLTDPYPGLGYVHLGGGNGGSVAPAVVAAGGNDAIVDWVVLELRENFIISFQGPGASAPVISSRSALLQRDGDVVDLDGTSPVLFPGATPGNYFLSVRHRNHLGCMTASTLAFDYTVMNVDLTSSTQATYGTEARRSIGGTFPAQALWAGDVTFNGEVKYLGASDDRDPVLSAIGGFALNAVLNNVYHQADVNMNGEVKYLGAGDDRDPILSTIGGVILNSVRVEQLP